MKELSIEQKAKAYDEALEKARKELQACGSNNCDAARQIFRLFPELKESEDEKSKKWILEYLHDGLRKSDEQFKDYFKAAIAWLEKQGEQKSKKVSIWKHWKNGIAGNGEGKQIFLTKFNNTYKLSSYLNSECDYIELSELDNLLLEKQGKTFTKKDVDDAYLKGISDTKNEIEKQYEANYQIRKDIATFIFNYRGVLKDRAKWMDYLGIKAYFVQEQDKQNPQSTKLKSAFEAWKDMRFEVYQQASGNRHEPNCSDDTTKMFSLNDIDEIFEKICEQESVEKVESKFKIEKGKWYICIRNLDDNYDTRAFRKGSAYYSTKDETLLPDNSNVPFKIKYCVNDYFRPWTIEDAKDGDVLCYETKNDFKSFIYKNGHINYYCCYTNGYLTTVDGFFDIQKHQLCYIHPATKEQCDFFFAKITEAGYKWDSEKKELKKIEQNSAIFIPKFRVRDKLISTKNPRLTYEVLEVGHINELGNPEYKVEIFTDGKSQNPSNIHYMECCKVDEWAKLIEQKTTWSEEDEKKLSDILAILRGGENFHYNSPILMDWLKSIKQRIGG